MRRAFTLIEMLVVVAIIALLAAILLPSLASAREAGRASVCLANLRQIFTACRMYADASRGYGPAIGEPYFALPNWALQVQAYCSKYARASSGLYRADFVLVCPTTRANYGSLMQRTYAMNTTGHAGQPADPTGAWPADPDTYDDPLRPAHIRLDRVPHPSRAVLLVDSARTPITGTAPPSARTASMLDFRQDDHVRTRLARFHRHHKAFSAALIDGAARSFRDVLAHWKLPLP